VLTEASAVEVGVDVEWVEEGNEVVVVVVVVVAVT
jgi:hypothetical protein